MYRKTYIEVNIDYINENLKKIIEVYSTYNYYIGVLKGDAYGHGDYIVNDIIKNGINYIAVSSLEEALSIREHNQEIPVLILGIVDVSYLDVCIKNKITITLADYDYFKTLLKEELTGTLKIHLKVNSGMNRLGIQNKNQITKIVTNLSTHCNFELEGIYTHFSTLGISDKIWDNQIQTFKTLTSDIDLTKTPIVHLGRTATLLNHPKIEFANGVRIGIGLFGYAKTPKIISLIGKLKQSIKKRLYHISTTLQSNLDLKTAFVLKSEVIKITDVKKGNYIGYGLSYQAKEDMSVAIIPIGYGDGFSRRNTGRFVAIADKKYQIVGDVCMDMIFVKIDKSVKVNDEVILMGNDVISTRYVANYLNTTVYETMGMLKDRIPRIFIKDNQVVYMKSKFKEKSCENER